ncbi:MAG: hypothetical protein NC247_08470 [Ruminococcus flavefaciens]|nr:hypothetical protein [Ruminococcus flavefaciens]MCM1362818.1 hypothetical protein [Clostridiales bacterium]MCM1436015.1 hypothetical protein [Ruminococcus flavefaciens]
MVLYKQRKGNKNPEAEFTWSEFIKLDVDLFDAERRLSPMEETSEQQREAGGLAE